MTTTTYGYARVSSKDQRLDRQIDALLQFPVPKERIYADKASGKDFKRPAWKRLIRKMKPGDALVVKSIDRLGRNYDEILEQWRVITKTKGCSIVVLDMPLLDTRESNSDITGTFLADIVLQLLSYIAQVERESIHQRQTEGIAAAKARGVRFGRPPISKPDNYRSVLRAFRSEEISRKEAASACGVGVTTFTKWERESSS